MPVATFTRAGQWGPEGLIDSAGDAQVGAAVALYLADGVTLATRYTDATKTFSAANPWTSDSIGNVTLFADPGQYVLKVTIGGLVTALPIEVPVDPTEVALDGDVITKTPLPTIADGTLYVSKGSKASDVTGDGLSPGSAFATIAAAAAAMGTARGVIILLHGTHDVGNGLSMSGKKYTIESYSPGMATVVASTQTRPVIDMTGWVSDDIGVAAFEHAIRFGGFTIQGSGVADPTKAKKGLKIGNPTGVFFHDIVIRQTGGECMWVDGAEGCWWDRMTFVQPVGGYTNSVNYVYITNAFNGNWIGTWWFRRPNVEAADPIDPIDILVVEDNGSAIPNGNEWEDLCFEFIRLPDNGSLIRTKANQQRIRNIRQFDSQNATMKTSATGAIAAGTKVLTVAEAGFFSAGDAGTRAVTIAGAATGGGSLLTYVTAFTDDKTVTVQNANLSGGDVTGAAVATYGSKTAHWRANPLSGSIAGADTGGNILEGVIPGASGGNIPSTAIVRGVVLAQSRNRVVGVKANVGSNVELAAGVNYSHVEFGGQVGGDTTIGYGVVDNSGTTTNVILDHTIRKLQWGDVNLYRVSAGRMKTDGGLDVVGTVTSGGKTLPTSDLLAWRHEIDPFLAPKQQLASSWAPVAGDTAALYGGYLQSPGAVNDSIDFDVVLAAGVWSVYMLHTRSTNKGIYTIQIDDGAGTFTSYGTVDGYILVAARNTVSSVPGIVLATSLRRTLRILMSDQNASSSGFFSAIQHITLRRTS